MVAYSFKARFADPIIGGTKVQTIRAHRKRHARPGEELQLYVGMRTRQCRLIGRRLCTNVLPVFIRFDDQHDEREGFCTPGLVIGGIDKTERLMRDGFAIRDGFADWSDLKAFWRANHPGQDKFDGVLIVWGADGQD